ncbi:MAG TPA: hypothetical protein V6C86_09570 [Oculatellaceae cyanobacterium]
MGIFGNLFSPQPPSEEEEKKSSALIDNLRKRRGSETGKWLSLMMRDQSNIPTPGEASTPAQVDQRPELKEKPYEPPMRAQYTTMSLQAIDPALLTQELPKSEAVEWVNRLFGEFAMQSAAFNSSAQGTHLIVTVHAPEFELEKPQIGEYTTEKKVRSFKGHLATLQWGMLVQGVKDKIDVYVVPSEKILNFMLHDITQSSYEPFMVIDSVVVNGKEEWHIEGNVITFDTIPLLAKELLGDLVRVASGQMDESELFAAQDKALKLGETVAQGFAPVSGAATQMGSASGSGEFSQLASWTAASAFIRAMDQDLPRLIEKKGDLTAAGKADEAKRVDDLITKLRTVSGTIGSLVAEFNPSASKYNAS